MTRTQRMNQDVCEQHRCGRRRDVVVKYCIACRYHDEVPEEVDYDGPASAHVHRDVVAVLCLQDCDTEALCRHGELCPRGLQCCRCWALCVFAAGMGC